MKKLRIIKHLKPQNSKNGFVMLNDKNNAAAAAATKIPKVACMWKQNWRIISYIDLFFMEMETKPFI